MRGLRHSVLAQQHEMLEPDAVAVGGRSGAAARRAVVKRRLHTGDPYEQAFQHPVAAAIASLSAKVDSREGYR